MRRIKTPQSQGRDYGKMLKDYFGFHLLGMEVKEEGGQMQAQVIYEDFKHIDTVRRELAQMMPEVEFTKLRREFTESAELWALRNLMWGDKAHPAPVIYVKRGKMLVETSLRDIANAELRQLELDEEDEAKIGYTEQELQMIPDEKLREFSWD